MTAPEFGSRSGVWDDLVPQLEAAGWLEAGEPTEEGARLLEILRAGPDPQGGLERVATVLAAQPVLATDALSDRSLGQALVTVCAASRAIASWIATDPEWLRDAAAPDSDRHALDIPGLGPPDRHSLIRRFVRRRLVRIAVWDLMRQAAMPEVGRALSDLADAVATAVLAAATTDVASMPEFSDLPPIPFLVAAMGKWGGQELNYASDIDVLFVYRVPPAADDVLTARYAARVAERFMDDIGHPTADGVAFRVDADLRPEGRRGPLARSLDAYRAYYERWADPWEFQALVKARPAAGDAALGIAFAELSSEMAYPESRESGFIREIRAMKGRAESEARRRGIAETEIKRGIGGIRDVEFAVQLLQLVHGPDDPDLRAPGTLDVLAVLGEHGYVRADDATELSASYEWLRDVEHRLQLFDFRQTHELPMDEAGRDRVAKAMGYRDELGRTALASFEEVLARNRSGVRAIHERLFYRPLLEAFAAAPEIDLSPESAARRLNALGFADVAGAEHAFADLTTGLTRRSRLMRHLLPIMLDWLSAAPDPDLGLSQLRLLVTTAQDNDRLIGALRDNPVAAERLCWLLGTSRLLGRLIDRIPAALSLLGDDEALGAVADRAGRIDAALRRVAVRPGRVERRRTLHRFAQRGILETALRDLLGFATPEQIGRELSGIADAAAAAALVVAGEEVLSREEFANVPPVPFTVVGMGNWGGRELHFASDLDVLFVYRVPPGITSDVASRFATRLAEEFVAVLGGITPEGTGFRIDPDLRPEGKTGPLARSLDSYRAYYERWADTWEFQSLIKARPVAGDSGLGAAFGDLIIPFVYRPDFDNDAVREIRTMKARIERERIPPGEDPGFHMKLGKGGLTDVAFACQLLQMRFGAARAELRRQGTIESIAALERAGLLTTNDAGALADSYRFCSQVRNRLFLQAGRARESFPADPDETNRLALSLGFDVAPRAALRNRYLKLTRRARRVVERRFYRD